MFTAAGYTISCPGADGSKYERKGAHGGGLAVRESIAARGGKDGLVVECATTRLMEVRMQLEGKSNAVSSLVGFAPILPFIFYPFFPYVPPAPVFCLCL